MKSVVCCAAMGAALLFASEPAPAQSIDLPAAFGEPATAQFLTAADASAVPDHPAAAEGRPEQHGAQNEANNPLTPKITINLHNYYIPEFVGSEEDGNQFLLRGLVPHKLGGLPQLFRFTLPFATVPDPSPDDVGSHTTGVSDLTLMNLFVIPRKPFEFGVGPLLVVPMGPAETSTEQWQAGAAGIVIAPQPWGLMGVLSTYQASFAGEDDREDVSLFTLQPLVIYNLPEGFYLRSTAVWNWDANGEDTYYIPLGLGAGKVWDLSEKVTVNAFVEPQYTVFEDNDAAPKWQIFFGLNFQFALR